MSAFIATASASRLRHDEALNPPRFRPAPAGYQALLATHQSRPHAIRAAHPAAWWRSRDLWLGLGSGLALLAAIYLFLPKETRHELDLATGQERTVMTIAGHTFGGQPQATPMSRLLVTTAVPPAPAVWVCAQAEYYSVFAGRTTAQPHPLAVVGGNLLRQLVAQPAAARAESLTKYEELVGRMAAAPGAPADPATQARAQMARDQAYIAFLRAGQ